MIEDLGQAYKFVSQTYQDGDRLFFFGFSRGAYTARLLAGDRQEGGVKSKFHVVEGGKPVSIFQDLEALRIPHDADEPDEATPQVETGEVWQASTFAMMPKLWHG
jgi:alpha/beta superfamily hydrolase